MYLIKLLSSQPLYHVYQHKPRQPFLFNLYKKYENTKLDLNTNKELIDNAKCEILSGEELHLTAAPITPMVYGDLPSVTVTVGYHVHDYYVMYTHIAVCLIGSLSPNDRLRHKMTRSKIPNVIYLPSMSITFLTL